MSQALFNEQSLRLERYYRFHSKIYDLTRWSFLFGRTALVQKVVADHSPAYILEVGCGTGKNLLNLGRRFPQVNITGLDVSEAMLAVAEKNLGSIAGRVTLLHMAYDQPLQPAQPFDIILFSYSLSMMNPGWSSAIECAWQDLAPDGLMAVVDFHNSNIPFFKRWMGLNHVRMDEHLLPKLETCFQPHTLEIWRAYAGLWSYLIFIGKKS